MSDARSSRERNPGSARLLRPRRTESLAVSPATVTDLTAPAVLGLEARPFREFLAREKVPHARVGHRVIARVDDVLAALDRVARRSAETDGGEEIERAEEHDDQPQTADEVLAALGKERVT